MPISRMYFDRDVGRDIHLIRGDSRNNTSRDIRDFGLVFVQTFTDGHTQDKYALDYFKDLQKQNKKIDVAVNCLPTFKHADDKISDNLENFGIHVNRVSGTVLVDKDPSAKPFPSNFILQVNATHIGPDGKPDTAAPSVLPLFIRVHVHDGVERIWITPKHLTVRRKTPTNAESTSNRFTVRARFTDGMVGDITLYHGVTWTPLNYFRGGPFRTFDTVSDAGHIQLPANFTDSSDRVTATWQVGGGTKTDTADFTVVPPWAKESVLPKIDLVSGAPAVWGGASPEPFPNILFLGAGFAKTDIAVFQAAVTRVSEDWKADLMTRPYDLLANSMNLWSVAVPAAVRGVSVRDVVYLPAAKNGAQALPMPQARKHEGGTAAWTLSNLVYAVGLPLPSYITELRVPDEGPINGVFKFWAATANQTIPRAAIPLEMIDKWLDLGNANFIDEIDSFPPMAVGSPPDADPEKRGNFITFHPDRLAIADLPEFFAAMPSVGRIPVSGGNLGHLWVDDPKDRPAFGFDNRNFVVTLIAGVGGAVQFPGVSICIPIKPGFHHDVTHVAGQLQHDPRAPLLAPIPKIFPEFSRLVAHELSHGFGLQDEYADFPRAFTGPESDLTDNPNVTSLAAVTRGGKVQSGMIKWNWDRIERAAVLSGPVTGGGGTFTIPLMPGHQKFFKKDDVVRLRRRTRLTPLARAIDTPVTFTGFQLTFSSLGAHSITVTSTTAKLSDFAPYKAGSLLYIPVPIAPANAASPFLKLIAPKIAAQMDDSGDPLTGPAAVCDPAIEAANKLKDQVPIIFVETLFPSLFSFRDTPYVVGLYTGGVRFGCGVFHPTGACMMRNHNPNTSVFCPVCRYALVDAIDPTKHREIDQDYAKIYPD